MAPVCKVQVLCVPLFLTSGSATATTLCSPSLMLSLQLHAVLSFVLAVSDGDDSWPNLGSLTRV